MRTVHPALQTLQSLHRFLSPIGSIQGFQVPPAALRAVALPVLLRWEAAHLFCHPLARREFPDPPVALRAAPVVFPLRQGAARGLRRPPTHHLLLPCHDCNRVRDRSDGHVNGCAAPYVIQLLPRMPLSHRRTAAWQQSEKKVSFDPL